MKDEINMAQLKSMENQYGEAPKLDLSKIQNMEVAKKHGIGDDFAATVEQKKSKAKKSKFCFTEEHEIKLPSGGLLYQDCEDEDIKNGIVRLKPMSLADEGIISNQTYIKNGTVFIHLLESCVMNNFNVKNFIPYDVFYLLYALRRITYGEDYKFEIDCKECGKRYEYSLDISQVDFEELDEEMNPHFYETIKLPISKYTVTIKTNTLGDEEEVNRLMNKKNYQDYSDVILNYVARTTSVLDDNNEAVNPMDFADFYEALPGKDRAEITKKFEYIDKLKIPTITVTCPKCGVEEEMTIPFNKEFFRY